MRRVASKALLIPTAFSVALVACGGPRSGGEPPRCPSPIAAPAGFDVVSEFGDAMPDRTATRSSLQDARGRSLHLFSGMEGEFGEGMAMVDEAVRLASGIDASLLGSELVWALVWRENGPCASRAVFASGFRREAFIRVMQEVGLLPR